MSNPVRQSLPVALSMALVFALFPALSHATHSWNGYHWARTSGSFTLNLGDNVSPAWDLYLVTAASDWSGSAVLDLKIASGGASNLKTCKPTSGRVEVCATTYGNNGWLGVASIWISSGHITQGTVKVNDTYFNTTKYNTPEWRKLVMCQEVGHTFGLDHQDETFDNKNLGTCMDYTRYPEGGVHDGFDYGPSNEHPGGTVASDSDFDELATVYSHVDGSTTVKQSVNNRRAGANNETPRLGTAQWGRLVRSTNQGRTELFELDLGRGNKVLTHVIWADPEE